MNKFFLFALIVCASELRAEDLSPTSEVVDPMLETTAPIEEIPVVVEPEKKEEAPVEVPPPAVVAPEPVTIAKKTASTPVQASVTEVRTENVFNHNKSRWIVNFGFEGMGYKVPLSFTGTQEKFKPEVRTFYGGRFGVGRQFHLGWGIVSTSRLEGFYMGTLFEKSTNAGPEQKAEEFAFIKRTGQSYGGDVSQSLGFQFNLKTKNPFMEQMTYLVVEPYVFAGLGRAKAYNRINYHYDTTITQEDYKVRMEDSLTNTSVGAGINFTANTGFFLYLKATQYRLNASKRSLDGISHPNGGSSDNIRQRFTDVTLDPVTVYALGGGYKF